MNSWLDFKAIFNLLCWFGPQLLQYFWPVFLTSCCNISEQLLQCFWNSVTLSTTTLPMSLLSCSVLNRTHISATFGTGTATGANIWRILNGKHRELSRACSESKWPLLRCRECPLLFSSLCKIVPSLHHCITVLLLHHFITTSLYYHYTNCIKSWGAVSVLFSLFFTVHCIEYIITTFYYCHVNISGLKYHHVHHTASNWSKSTALYLTS